MPIPIPAPTMPARMLESEDEAHMTRTAAAVALILNAGSSSLKFAVYEITGSPVQLARGLVERIGGEPHLRADFGDAAPSVRRNLVPGQAPDHVGALAAALALLRERLPEARVEAVGHRVVHGGPSHAQPVIVTADVLTELRRLIPFAPIHQPHNLAGIEAARAAFPGALQVACFDTAFHRTQPWVNDTFALPPAYYERGVRRYGFHGISYDYVAGELSRLAPACHAGRTVIAHLGNGASMCAALGGRSIASTMGFTPLDGLPMGTRCGQIDPGVVLYMLEQEGQPVADVAHLLYNRSGLLGMSGRSNDLRTLEEAGDPAADAALGYFTERIRQETGRLAAALGGLDALVFTAGIGENSARVRAEVCEGLRWMGIDLHRDRNAGGVGQISTDGSRVRVLVIPTDEEIVIARAAASLIGP